LDGISEFSQFVTFRSSLAVFRGPCAVLGDNLPVAMAAIVRRIANTAAISFVYTPPPWRGRGYAGSVTAALVEYIFSQGRTTACLYTDLRNPFSNRCYAKIGFQPVCDALSYSTVP
jgi:predicted GNAT family acetyltransferase